MDNSIEFPVIAISKNDSFEVITDWDDLCGCSWPAFKNGYYEDLSLYDSSGVMWQVLSVKPLSKPSLFSRLFNSTMNVDISIGKAVENAKDMALKYIFDLIDNDPDDLYCQFVTHEELKDKMRLSETPSDLIEIAQTMGGAS